MAFNSSTNIKQVATDLSLSLGIFLVLNKAAGLQPKEATQVIALFWLGSEYFLSDDESQSQSQSQSQSPSQETEEQSNLSVEAVKKSFNHFKQSIVTFFNVPDEEESETVKMATDILQICALSK